MHTHMQKVFLSFAQTILYGALILGIIAPQVASAAEDVSLAKSAKSRHSSKKDKSPKKSSAGPFYVTTQCPGQMGNQMFYIATTLAYAWDNNLKATFPFLHVAGLNRPFNREHLFFRLDTYSPPTTLTTYKEMSCHYRPIPPMQDVFLEGNYFSYKYFHHHRDKILALFAPSNQVLEYLYAKYADLLALPNTVGVHVRTTSRKVHETTFPFPGLNYYGLAMDNFPADTVFVVFSDRINWCKKNFNERFPNKNFVFIEGNNHVQDIFLLSMMKHHVLSNLTFSWWGAYMNTNPAHLVYVPMHLTRPNKIDWPISDYFLPEWHVVPYDFLKDPYPVDMELYDEKSQSLHEQKRQQRPR